MKKLMTPATDSMLPACLGPLPDAAALGLRLGRPCPCTHAPGSSRQLHPPHRTSAFKKKSKATLIMRTKLYETGCFFVAYGET